MPTLPAISIVNRSQFLATRRPSVGRDTMTWLEILFNAWCFFQSVIADEQWHGGLQQTYHKHNFDTIHFFSISENFIIDILHRLWIMHQATCWFTNYITNPWKLHSTRKCSQLKHWTWLINSNCKKNSK